MRIAVGCDHRGLELKQFIIKLLTAVGYDCHDSGCYSTESVDYPDIAKEVCEAVAGGSFDRGILICDTGTGMSLAANKIKGIRAALCPDVFRALRARQHNDANVLCLSARDERSTVSDIIDAFCNTAFEGGRHSIRLDKIRDMER